MFGKTIIIITGYNMNNFTPPHVRISKYIMRRENNNFNLQKREFSFKKLNYSVCPCVKT
jgi:hypothetical protein